MAAAVVEFVDLAGRRFVFFEELGVGEVEGLGEDQGLVVFEDSREVLEGNAEREEFTEGVPAEVVFLFKLPDVFRRGTTGTGLEEATAVHEWNDGEHLGRGAEFEDREEICQVVTQHVTGHGDGVLTCLGTLECDLCRFDRCKDAEVETAGVVIFEVCLYLGDELGIVRTLVVEPKDGRCARWRGARATASLTQSRTGASLT